VKCVSLEPVAKAVFMRKFIMHARIGKPAGLRGYARKAELEILLPTIGFEPLRWPRLMSGFSWSDPCKNGARLHRTLLRRPVSGSAMICTRYPLSSRGRFSY